MCVCVCVFAFHVCVSCINIIHLDQYHIIGNTKSEYISKFKIAILSLQKLYQLPKHLAYLKGRVFNLAIYYN
jgi:hypothetical protein